MAEIRALPARLDFVRPEGDDFTATVSVVDDADVAVDISGWTLSGDGCTATITNGAGGVFTVVPSASTVGVRPWRVSRTAPDARSLVAGSDRVSEAADTTAGAVAVDLQLVDGDAVTLSVTAGEGTGVAVHDDGVAVDTVGTLNFTGATVTVSGGTATIAISPAGSAALDDLTDVDTAGGSTGDVVTQQADGSFALETPAAGGGGGDLSAADIDTLAELNAIVTDATLDDSSASRTPSAHALGGAEHTASTLAALNTKVSDATLDDSSDSRTPTAHTLGGAAHSADTLANLNAKVSDATLDDASASRTPSAHAASHATAGSDPLAPSDIGADPAGTAASAVTTHEGEADPHSGAYVAPGDNADTLGSGAAADGTVLTADGLGGSAFETPASGVTDHGLLSGLADDDHSQYALADGTRGTFATSAQGDLADTAVQPGDDADTLGSGAASDGQVLTADGAGGAAWEAAAGGGGSSTWTELARTKLASSAASVTLEEPTAGDWSDYVEFRLTYQLQSTRTGADARRNLVIVLNGNATGDNYHTVLYNTRTNGASGSGFAGGRFYDALNYFNVLEGLGAVGDGTSPGWGYGRLHFDNFGSYGRTISGQFTMKWGASGVTSQVTVGGVWKQNSAITSILLEPDANSLSAGGTVLLEGRL